MGAVIPPSRSRIALTGVDKFDSRIGGDIAPPSDPIAGQQSGLHQIVESREGYTQGSGRLFERHYRREANSVRHKKSTSKVIGGCRLLYEVLIMERDDIE